jgi:ribonuclease G
MTICRWPARLRDLVTPEVERVRIDSRAMVDKATDFAAKYIPEIKERIDHYQGERPLFDLYGVEEEIRKALERKVQLKSGGHLVIDQTEAMTTIDVNTGAFVGHRNLEETIFKTNLEAAQAICRQLRLRNLGGIIIIDFIDMTEDEHKRQVLRAWRSVCQGSRQDPYHRGLHARSGGDDPQAHPRVAGACLSEPCPYCAGRGSVKTAQTTCYEIFREILRESRQFDVETLLVLGLRRR